MVIFLQNAWSPVYAGGPWPRKSWLLALERSRSGQRLVHLTDDLTLCENTTPIVGPTPDSVIPPDFDHIQDILTRLSEEAVVVTCGQQAEQTLLALWPGRLVSVPHPAHRLVTNQLYQLARAYIAHLETTGKFQRVRFRQYKEYIGIQNVFSE